jgi:hypothetical protein
MSKVVLRALGLIGDHLRTHKSGGGADAPLDLAKQVVQQRMDNPAPAAPPVAEAAPKNTTQGSVFAKKKEFALPEIRRSSDDPHEVADASFAYNKVHGPALVPIEKLSGGVDLSQPDQRRRIDALKEHISHPERGHISRLIVDTDGNVIEGQHRFEALKELGAKHVPVHIIEDIGRGVDEDKMNKAIKEAGPISSDHLHQIVQMVMESVGDSGSPAKAREEWEAPRGFEPHWHAALDHLESIGKSEGGDVEGFSNGGGKTTQGSVFAKQKVDKTAQPYGPVDQPALREFLNKPATNYKSWDDVPDINPQELIGKKVGSLLADLTRAGGKYTGIDSSQVAKPEPMLGGPGYPLMDESQQHKLGWAVQGKGKGTAKLSKDMDYIAVHAMNPTSHLSNASMANAINETMAAYARDKRFSPEALSELNNLVRTTSTQKEHEKLKNFPGFEHPEIEKYLKDLNFESRLRISQLLGQSRSQELGAPNIDKITRDTLDKNFAGVPYGHAMFLLEIPKGSSESLVHLQQSNLPIHPSYDWGIHGRIVGKFAHPVAPEILHKDWFDQKQEENKTKVTPTGRPPNLRRAFELSLPTTTITKEIADMLPHRPADIQSGKAAQLALNAFNDHWHDTDTPVTEGGLGPATLSSALRNSDASSTLSQYSEKDIKDMRKAGKFTGYKLKDGEVYFGLKRGTNYADEYGFHHPDLTNNETALTSVVNNEPGAKGIGGAPVVLKALQHGATTLDAYSVPTDKHPNGFLPDFYSHFGFKKLGTIPFNEKYITHDENGNEKPFGKQHLADIKHEWAKTGWDEKRHGLPSIAIMKWSGEDENRADAVRRFVTQGGEGFGSGSNPTNVEAAAQSAGQGVGPSAGKPQRQRGLGNTSGNRGPVGADNAPRSSDRFTRTLAAVKNLSPSDAQHYGLSSEDIDFAKANGLKRGGSVHPASVIPGVHIVGHNPIFHGDE